MLRLVPHIESLLRVHDCVVVPQLGGFVLQLMPASYIEEKHLFCPMHKEVFFNAKLQNNDGLLAERYMNAGNVSYAQACRMLKEDVDSIREQLHTGMNVLLGSIGSLRMGEEGQLIFRPGKFEAFSIESYGLSRFQMETCHTLKNKGEANLPRNPKNTFYIPINRNLLRGVAAVAAAVAMFLMISTPVKEVAPSSYAASFIPTDVVVNKPVTTAPISTTPVVSTPAVSTPAPEATTTRTPVRREVKREEIITYHVIIGSVGTKRQADEFILKINRLTMPRVDRLVGDGRIRISADQFTDKSRAEAYLARIKESTRYYDAWLLAKKN